MHTEKKGFWERNWPWAVPCGCLSCLVLPIGACVVLIGGTLGLVRSSEVFEMALERAREDPRVIAEIGQPIEAGWVTEGEFDMSDDETEADFRIPISGPDGDARLRVKAVKRGGDWEFERLEVRFDSGAPRVDLLEDGD